MARELEESGHKSKNDSHSGGFHCVLDADSLEDRHRSRRDRKSAADIAVASGDRRCSGAGS